MEILFLIAGLGLGGIIIWFLAKSKFASSNVVSHEKYNEVNKAVIVLQEKLNHDHQSKESAQHALDQAHIKIEGLQSEVVKKHTENQYLIEKLHNQQQELSKLQQEFSKHFENIAFKILEQNTQKFSESSMHNLKLVLDPLKEKINDFEKKIKDTHDKDLQNNAALRQQIVDLKFSTENIVNEANNLTKALKGDTKAQGNWGEMVLEKVLEASGLRKGIEYVVQAKDMRLVNEDGERYLPDIIVHLPDKKHIIIDSKVSLTAYEQLINASADAEKMIFTKKHIDSVKKHVVELSNKNYHNLEKLNSPDFVLLFFPIEASFSIAIQHDIELFNFSWSKNIIIVSPSTLLATLRTIASLWQKEQQTKNALEIAKQSGMLYDKFVGFLTDLERIGKSIQDSQKNYENALNKLKGHGSLVSRVDNIKKLGAKTTKSIPENFIDEVEEKEY